MGYRSSRFLTSAVPETGSGSASAFTWLCGSSFPERLRSLRTLLLFCFCFGHFDSQWQGQSYSMCTTRSGCGHRGGTCLQFATLSEGGRRGSAGLFLSCICWFLKCGLIVTGKFISAVEWLNPWAWHISRYRWTCPSTEELLSSGKWNIEQQKTHIGLFLAVKSSC